MPNNAFERQANVIAGIMSRRAKFFDEFLGVGQQPPFTKKLNRTEQRDYFRSQPPQKQVELWQQMDANEQDIMLGNEPKHSNGEDTVRRMGY